MKTPPCADNHWRAMSMGKFIPDTLCCVGLLGRWRPISGHLRHARLANSRNYWQRRSSRNWRGTRLAIIPSPS